VAKVSAAMGGDDFSTNGWAEGDPRA